MLQMRMLRSVAAVAVCTIFAMGVAGCVDCDDQIKLNLRFSPAVVHGGKGDRNGVAALSRTDALAWGLGMKVNFFDDSNCFIGGLVRRRLVYAGLRN